MVPYNEKIWNFPTERMSAHWVEGRIPMPPVEDVIRSAIGIETEGYTHQSIFSYPAEGGIEALVHALERGLEGKIITDFPVRTLRYRNGAWEAGDGRRTVSGDRVVSTIPLQELAGCLGGVPPEVAAAVKNLRYNSVACVQVGIRGTVPLSPGCTFPTGTSPLQTAYRSPPITAATSPRRGSLPYSPR